MKTIVVETGVGLPRRELGVDLGAGAGSGCERTTRLRQRAAERRAALHEVLDLGRLRARVVVRARPSGWSSGIGSCRRSRKIAQLGLGQLLGLVGDVAGLDAGARASSP